MKLFLPKVIFLALLFLNTSNYVLSQQSNAFPVIPELVVPDGTFRSAEGIAFTGEGRLFVTADDALWEIEAGGKVRKVITLYSAVGLAPIGKRDVIVLDFGPTNGINHGPNTDGLVLRVTPEGKKTSLATGIGDPNFVVKRKDGSLLISDDFTNNIWEVSKKGKVTLLTNAIVSPNGMVISPDGKTLYVAQIFKNFKAGVRPIECDNHVWGIPLLEGRPNGSPVAVFTSPGIGCIDGLAMDSKGLIYVAANREGKIWRVDPSDGSYILMAEQSAASFAFGKGKFDNRSIYITDLKTGKVMKIPVGVTGARLYR